jgi:hypothetical protein
MPKQPNQIIGSFVLRNEGDGCLTSKYHHGESLQCPFTESCKLITPMNPNDVFAGTYRTVWLEDNNHVAAELLIQRHQTNNNIFELFWRDPNNNRRLLFEGTAMAFDNLLIGAYWN